MIYYPPITLEEGMVVRLKSGGFKMTVTTIHNEGKDLSVNWHNGSGEMQYAYIHTSAIVPVNVQ